ncbi:hypothetical protein GCM10007049_07650 [Echinicola pacifica]|uniref:Response regulatory domain-containing protein n=1 Tax=Echinicola pacifica TaxID=346377 RepID=A0A918PP33_9BACT|nr:response regulator [Echinicola pacifica]GGZ17537.1 hypothetical protein GCM10007049_07650 [Echinicola pacifica]
MKKLLLIEDDVLILKMVEFKLKKEGYEVHIAKDGKEGIEKIDELKPDIIISDIVMPYKSGIEIVHYTKQNYPDTPVIVLSELGEEEKTVIEAFQLGAVDFVSKPFNPQELVLRLKRFV